MRALLLLCLLVSAGCGGDPSAPDENEAENKTFIALQRDFQAFPGWASFRLEGDGSGSPHTGFNRDIYLNQRPPKGSTEFPVGTIIVKRTDGIGDADGEGPRTFAMVKRGGGYNKLGAQDWEWFELLQSNPDDPASPWVISWRGLGPTTGGGYGPGGAECNGCHGQSQANDYVQSPQLQLSTLAR